MCYNVACPTIRVPQPLNQPSRRTFLGQISATLATGALAAPVIASAQSSSTSENSESDGKPASRSHNFNIPDHPRVRRAFENRLKCALDQALVPIPSHQTNGDQQRYPDGSATYTKAVLQDSIGLVNPAAYQTLNTALVQRQTIRLQEHHDGRHPHSQRPTRRPGLHARRNRLASVRQFTVTAQSGDPGRRSTGSCNRQSRMGHRARRALLVLSPA